MFDLFRHKGYGTKRHIQLLNQYGPTKNHRKSFKPISKISKRKLIKYESLSIIQYAIYLIKNGYDIYLITTTSFMIVKHKIQKLNIYTVSINRYAGLSMLDKVLFEIKQKDSVNNGRLDVIYDDDSINFIPQYSCKVV